MSKTPGESFQTADFTGEKSTLVTCQGLTRHVITRVVTVCLPFRLISIAVLFASFAFVADVRASLNIGVSSSNYLGLGAAGRQDSYSALDLGLDTKTESTLLDSRALVQAEIGFDDSSYRFVEFPEMYLATSKALLPSTRTSLGRKLVSWSALDDAWGAGAFQPRFRWDYLRPQQVGLLGLYEEVEAGPVRITAFYSPIFIPDRGAPLDFADGRVRSISPWAVNPPYQTDIQGKPVDVRYDAQIPPIKDIVRQDTFAGQVAVGEARGPWGSLSYAHKPMNELLMSYEAHYSTAAGDAQATIYPRVAYHHVAGADVGFRQTRMAGSLSAIADLPIDTVPNVPRRVSQQVRNMFLLSPTFTLYPFADSRAGNLSVSYLRVFGKDPPDVGNSTDGFTLADGVSSEFDSRYPFKSAFLLGSQFPTWRKLTADVRLLVDLQNPGTIVSWNFSYAADRDWRLFLATDVLSSFTGDSADGTDFIHRYRENDRVTGGVTYVF